MMLHNSVVSLFSPSDSLCFSWWTQKHWTDSNHHKLSLTAHQLTNQDEANKWAWQLFHISISQSNLKHTVITSNSMASCLIMMKMMLWPDRVPVATGALTVFWLVVCLFSHWNHTRVFRWSYIWVTSLVSHLCEWQSTGRLTCPQAASFMCVCVCCTLECGGGFTFFSSFVVCSWNSSSARTTTRPRCCCCCFTARVMLSNESGN